MSCRPSRVCIADKGSGILLYVLGISWLVVFLFTVDNGSAGTIMQFMTMSILQIGLGTLRVLPPCEDPRGLGEPFVLHVIAGSFTTGLLLGIYPPWLAGANFIVHAVMVFVTLPARDLDRDAPVPVGVDMTEDNRPVTAEPIPASSVETA